MERGVWGVLDRVVVCLADLECQVFLVGCQVLLVVLEVLFLFRQSLALGS